MSDPRVEGRRSQDRHAAIIVRLVLPPVQASLLISQGGQAGGRVAKHPHRRQRDDQSSQSRSGHESDDPAQRSPQTQDRSSPHGSAEQLRRSRRRMTFESGNSRSTSPGLMFPVCSPIRPGRPVSALQRTAAGNTGRIRW